MYGISIPAFVVDHFMVNVGKCILDQNPGWLFEIGDFSTQIYCFFINQYKDPYKPISILECHVSVLNAAQMETKKI